MDGKQELDIDELRNILGRYNFCMFDGLDIGPLCCAPFVALFISAIVYGVGKVSLGRAQIDILRTNNGNNRLLVPISVVIFPCTCILSIFLGIGSAVPTPWLKPSTINISGEWVLTQCTMERFEKRWDAISENQGYIKFNFDKTVEVNNLPALWALSYPKHQDEGRYISGTGNWHIEETSGRIGNREWFLFAQLNIVNDDTANELIGFYFDGHLPPYTLAFEENINLIHFTKRWNTLSYYFCLPWD